MSAPARPSIAIYIHWPWCAAICPYCDFDKQATDFRLADAYIGALIAHLHAESSRAVHSIYLGGGTPSLLRPDRLRHIIEACRAQMDVLPDCEVTLEANPSDIVPHKVEAYLQAGVNRISLGVQSLVDEELRFLGRRHDAAKAVRAALAVRETGCENLSLDLMYGLPGQSEADLQRSLDGLIDLDPAHLSCYALTLEDDTPMGDDVAAGVLKLPEDEVVAASYELIQSRLARTSLDQYELSNWARAGRQAIHNLTYWRNGEWLGLGAGAAGSIAGLSYKRHPLVTGYIASAARGDPAYGWEEPWTRESQMRDTVMLGLRLAEGVSDRDFRDRFGCTLTDYCTDRLDDLVAAGVLIWKGDRLALAPSRYFVSNAVIADLLP
ncbi:MAG: radical SAM family heme chaperone HemW [Chloroflexi bacterium]|nr:radical SAM family heme chaperone HemW [Chloroflexota bacterium]